MNFRNREMKFDGDTLYFWCFSEDEIAGDKLPLIRLSDVNQNFSRALEMGKFQSSIPARKWVQVGIPLSEFETGSIHFFQAHRAEKIVFGQNAADGVDQQR